MDGVVISAPPLYTTLPAANKVLASPDGAPGKPVVRALVAADLPSLPGSIIGSGTVAAARLGSGTQDSTTFLRGDGTWSNTLTGPYLAPNGSLPAAAFAFANDPDTGMYLASVGNLAFDVEGNKMLQLDSTNLYPFGPIQGVDGSASAPSHAFASNPNTGMFFTPAGGRLAFTVAGVVAAVLDSAVLELKSSAFLAWSAGDPTVSSADLFLSRVAANILGLYNGANANEIQAYEFRTDDSNYSRLFLRTVAGTHLIGTEKAGTGTARALAFQTNGTTAMTLGTDQSATFAAGVTVKGDTFSGIAANTSATPSAVLLQHGTSGSQYSVVRYYSNTTQLAFHGAGATISGNSVGSYTTTSTDWLLFVGSLYALALTTTGDMYVKNNFTAYGTGASSFAGRVIASGGFVAQGDSYASLAAYTASNPSSLILQQGSGGSQYSLVRYYQSATQLAYHGVGAGITGTIGSHSIAATDWVLYNGAAYQFGVDTSGNAFIAGTVTVNGTGASIFSGLIYGAKSTGPQLAAVGGGNHAGSIEFVGNAGNSGPAFVGSDYGGDLAAGDANGDLIIRNDAGDIRFTIGTATGLRLDTNKTTIFAGGARLLNSTVANLPAAATAGAGALAFVTDATLTTVTGLGLAVTGGGANKTVVYSDGTNWIII